MPRCLGPLAAPVSPQSAEDLDDFAQAFTFACFLRILTWPAAWPFSGPKAIEAPLQRRFVPSQCLYSVLLSSAFQPLVLSRLLEFALPSLSRPLPPVCSRY